MSKILVLGGSVFIGKAIVEKLIECGHEVYVLNRGNHQAPKGSIQLIADRNKLEEFTHVLDNLVFDVVFDGSAYLPNQTKIAIETLKNRVGHYIHISSAAVYSSEQSLPLNENSNRGLSKEWGDYSVQKYLCEEELFKAYEENNFPMTIIRPFYIYGPGNNLDRETYIWKRLLSNIPIAIPNKGLSAIQFGYIDDLTDALVKIMNLKDSIGKAYNLSGKEVVTLKEWVEECGKAAGIEPKIIYINTK